VQKIDRVPADIKAIYKTAFEIDAKVLVDAGSRRQKWIDQAQSLNLYMAAPSGKKLDELYRHAWLSGLKTTYYLRTLGATHAEKTTIQDGRLNQVGNKGSDAGKSAAKPASMAAASEPSAPKVCSILDPDCEACQ
jgi:ribonucleoside-diphosphate reductase alpha chain